MSQRLKLRFEAGSFSTPGTVTSKGSVATIQRTLLGGSLSNAYLGLGTWLQCPASNAIYTDISTPTNGSQSDWFGCLFTSPTISTTNTGVIYTNASSVCIKPPIAGTNMSITNSYALQLQGNFLLNSSCTLISQRASNSSSATAGAFQLSGGIGISLTTDATSSISGGSFTTAGGMAIGKKLYVGTSGNFGTSYSGTPSTTSGAFLNIPSSTFTDSNTANSGTVSQWAAGYYSQPTIAASNTGVIYTNAATLYLSNAPTAGSNVTITNPYTLQVAAGNVNLGPGVITIPGNLFTTKRTMIGQSYSASFLGVGVWLQTPQSGSATFTDTSTASNGTQSSWSGAYFTAPQLAASNSNVTYTTASTVQINSPFAGTNATITNAYALLVNGNTSVTSTTDATSSTNGGSVSTAGGMAIAKKLITGSTAMIGGTIFENRSVTAISNSTGQTLTASQITGSYIVRSGANSGQTDTFPTAALLVASITNCQVGTTFTLHYLNTSSNSITMAAGSGGTYYGSTTVSSTTGLAVYTFIIRNVTASSEAYDVLRTT